ncbi:single-stranded DNA-binding protein, partial [Pasteurella multocida]
MAGVNRVIILGNLGNDPDVRTMPNGDPVAKIRYRIRDARLSLWYELINPEKVIEDAFNTSIENLQ